MLPLNPNEAYSKEVYREEERRRRDNLPSQPQKDDFKKIIDSLDKAPKDTPKDIAKDYISKDNILKKDISKEDISLDEATKQEAKTNISTAWTDYKTENQPETAPEPIYIELTPEQVLLLNKLKSSNQAFSMADEAESTQQLNQLLLELSIEKTTKRQELYKNEIQASYSKSTTEESSASKTLEKTSYYLSISPEQARKLQDLMKGENLKLGGENPESLTAAIDLFQNLSTSAQNALSNRQIPNALSPEALQKGNKLPQNTLEPQLTTFEKSVKDKNSPFMEDFFGSKTQAQSGRVGKNTTPSPFESITEAYKASPSMKKRTEESSSASATSAVGKIVNESESVYLELTPLQAEVINKLKSLAQAPSTGGQSESVQKLNTVLQGLQLEKTSTPKIEPNIEMARLTPNAAEGKKVPQDYYYLEISPEQAKQLQTLDMSSLPLQNDSQNEFAGLAKDLFKDISTTANDLLNKRELPNTSTTNAKPIIGDSVQRSSTDFEIPIETPATYQQQKAPASQSSPSTPFSSDQFTPDISSLEQSRKGGGTNIGNMEKPITQENQPIGEVYAEGRSTESRIEPLPLRTTPETRNVTENIAQSRSIDAGMGQRVPPELKPESPSQAIRGYAEGRSNEPRIIERGPSTLGAGELRNTPENFNQPRTTPQTDISIQQKESISPSSSKIRDSEQQAAAFYGEQQEAQLTATPVSTNAQKDVSTPLNAAAKNENTTTQPLGAATTAAIPQSEEIKKSRQTDKASGKERSTEAEAASASNMTPPPLQPDIPIQIQTTEVKGPSQEEVVRLINELVDQIMVIKNQGQTDTVVTLRSPKILEGSTIKISTYDQARGEVNITFANLTPEAKRLLDNNLARESLTDTLKNRTDIVVHNVITTTQEEIPVYARPEPREGQEKDKQQGQGRDQE